MPLTLPLISLRVRFMAVAVILTLGSSVIWGGWTWQRERTSLFERISREGEMLVSTMAIPIINALLYEELGIILEGGLLDNFVGEIMATPRLEIHYAVVLNEEGRVLAHNRFAEYGETYDDPLSIRALQADGFVQTDIVLNGARMADLAMPLAIAGKSWGSLRVGISMEPAYAELVRLERQLILFVALFSIGALVIYWFIGTWLAYPITALTRNMEHVGKDLTILPVRRFRRDEIGLLQKSFADMLERLQQSEREREASLTRMLENERILAIGRLVSGVAHEVNNPLAGIEGALYQIEQKGGDKVQRYAGLVRQSIERIGRIVGQLSDLSRVGAISRRRVDSSEFFEDLVTFSRMALKDHDCGLTPDNRCPQIDLFIDRDKIHQVVLNLVLNAADATGGNSRIGLVAEQADGHYLLHVENSGPEIPPEIADQMFDPFFTTKEAGLGSGMGLAISRGIAEKHGGSLEYGRVDERTVFTLSIPVRAAKDNIDEEKNSAG
ncbi:MAG: ATP-binding protein [Pelovirga sp.]